MILKEYVNNVIQESHYRGEASLRACLCDLLRKFCDIEVDYTKCMLHHKNGNHSINNVDNLILFPTDIEYRNPNSVIHALQKREGFTFSPNDKEYLEAIAKLFGIDVWKSIQVGHLVSSNNQLITTLMDNKSKEEDKKKLNSPESTDLSTIQEALRELNK